MNFNAIMQVIAVAALPLIFAITLHEAAHGWVASKLGDKTALMMGRVSLNPARHIDPIGTIALPLIMLMLGGIVFGWAKPVPVTWQNLKHPRRDMALVAIAGPFANLIMAFIWALIAKLGTLMLAAEATNHLMTLVGTFFNVAGNFGIMINLVLMILNLLPVPPLDGSRIISAIIPLRWTYYYDKLEPYGLWILLALLIFGVLASIILPPVRFLAEWIRNIFGL